MTHVSVAGLSKSFQRADGTTVPVLAGTTFDVMPGSVAGLVGPNGCGKSTVLAILASILQPDAGGVLLATGGQQKTRIGFVWQNYRASLLPWLSAEENVAFPLRLRGTGKRERLDAAAQLFAKADARFDVKQPVYRLSGGQQQLICLLRALVHSPDLLLVDEPTSALDLQAKWRFFEHCERLRQEHPTTTIWVSHDPDEAALVADEILLMSAGGGQIADTIRNPLPRPRTVSMLRTSEHLACRERILTFIVGGSDNSQQHNEHAALQHSIH